MDSRLLSNSGRPTGDRQKFLAAASQGVQILGGGGMKVARGPFHRATARFELFLVARISAQNAFELKGPAGAILENGTNPQ